MTKKMTRNEKRLAKKAAEKKKSKKPVEIKRKPRAQRLPGMEDAGIQELENLANDIADAIGQKKELMASEKTLNESLVAAMKKHGKTTYSHRGVHIDLTATEKAKVVIKDFDDTPADAGSAPSAKVGDAEVVHSDE